MASKCARCDFVAKSAKGLKVHMSSKHKKRPQKDREELSPSPNKARTAKEEVVEEDDASEHEERPVVGDAVGVNLSELRGFLDFRYCHMDGVVEQVAAQGSAPFTVVLDGLDRRVKVSRDRLEPKRGAEPRVEWVAGDAVHVLETNDGIDGWWEATIVAKEKSRWKVKWTGQYTEHGDETAVSGNRIRRAVPVAKK